MALRVKIVLVLILWLACGVLGFYLGRHTAIIDTLIMLGDVLRGWLYSLYP